MRCAGLIVFLTVWSALSCHGQLPSFRFQKITTREGLPGNTVLSAVRDHQGFMWFGTRRCPIRFDGVTFQSIMEPESNLITGLAVDKDNTIWMGTDLNGVCKIDTKTMRMVSIPRTNRNTQTGDFYIDSRGNGWYSDRYAAHKINLASLDLKTYPLRQTNYVWNKSSFAEGANNTMWIIGRDNGLFRYDSASDKITCVWGVDASDPAARQSVLLSKGFIDHEGILWLGTFDIGLVRYDTRTGKHQSFRTGRINNEVRDVEEGVDEYGKRILWVGDENGLGIFRPDQQKFYYFTDIMDEPYEVNDIYRDPVDGIVWVSTSKGIIKYHPRGNIIRTRLLPEGLVRNPVEVNVVMQDIRPDHPETFYLGLSHTGMIEWNRVADKFTLIPYPNANANTRWMEQKSDGMIYIGTHREDYVRPGIFVYDPQKGAFVDTPLTSVANRYYSVPFFMYGYFDREDKLWIGNSDEGIHVFKGVHDVTPWKDSTQLRLLSDNNLMTSMLSDRSGRTWVGTYQGLMQANFSDGTFTNWDIKNLPDSLSDRAVTTLMEDRDGNVWAARWGSITVLSPDGKLLAVFKTINGFYDRENRGLAQDAAGNIWLGNYEGLYCIEPTTKRILRFTINDGLLQNNTAGRVFTSRDGKWLAIGYINGFNFVELSELFSPSAAPPLAISRFSIHEKEHHPDLSKPIILKRTDNAFSVDFITLNYRKEQNNQYAYYLSGLETDWHYSGSEHRASYTNLSPGTYTLHLKAGDAFGNWNYGNIDLTIIVQPAFYETWWFRLLIVAAISALIYGFFRYRINQLLRVQQMRNRISADLHDELGSSLSSISIMGTMAGKALGAEHPSLPLLERMTDEIQQISGSLDDIVWNISPKNDALSSLTARMMRYSSELFEAKQIPFSLVMPDNIEQVKLTMEQRRNLYLVFKEAVNNLVKYSACTKASVSLTVEDRSLSLSVRDNGKGFDTAAVNDRHGLHNLKARAAILKGILSIESAPGKGTCVQLIVPLRRYDHKGGLTKSRR